MPLLFFNFFFRNEHFTVQSSYSLSIYNITIDINTLTTMNNQFKTLNSPKIDFHSSYLISYALKQHLFHFLSLFIQKTKDFDFKLFKVHRAIQPQESWSLTSGSFSC